MHEQRPLHAEGRAEIARTTAVTSSELALPTLSGPSGFLQAAGRPSLQFARSASGKLPFAAWRGRPRSDPIIGALGIFGGALNGARWSGW